MPRAAARLIEIARKQWSARREVANANGTPIFTSRSRRTKEKGDLNEVGDFHGLGLSRRNQIGPLTFSAWASAFWSSPPIAAAPESRKRKLEFLI